MTKTLKKRRAAGTDKMRAESFIYGGQSLNESMAAICTRQLGGDNIPDDWREGRLVPIYKKGPRDDPKNYRGLTICNSSYKLYTKLILNRLTIELEENGLLPDNQAGFRRHRSTIDHIYSLDTIAQSRLQDGKKLFCLFVDLKAAFDTIDRTKLF